LLKANPIDDSVVTGTKNPGAWTPGRFVENDLVKQ